MSRGVPRPAERKLRSQLWFNNPDNPGMTALYLERYLNYGLTAEELTSGKPIIGIAQTGSDLAPCNRHDHCLRRVSGNGADTAHHSRCLCRIGAVHRFARCRQPQT